jgi:pyridoxine 5-phosphate synthase
MIRLGVNIDHIATLRNARQEKFPSVVEVALLCETHGADLITAHLREDRRHIQDNDIVALRHNIKTQLNLEMAATPQMLDFALNVKPDFVCLVPERRQELTTEGGLNIVDNLDNISNIIQQLSANNIRTSLFVDASEIQIKAAADIKAYAVEIHTGKYALSNESYLHNKEYYKIKNMCALANSLNLVVNAGHGLNYHNVQAIAQLPPINELNIGFAIIAHSIFVGMPLAVEQMKQLMVNSRYQQLTIKQ